MVEASAPSNIALIKYMGKTDTVSNIPSNSSLSYTLEKLRTTVVIEKKMESQDGDSWSLLSGKEYCEMKLTDKGKKKFLDHFNRLKTAFGIVGNYHIRSANNFASDAGLASSASSFAALTKATYLLKKSQEKEFNLTDQELSALSRSGSGSSCRSFFSPWSVWDAAGAREIELPIKDLIHHVFVFESQAKKVSSSEAHLRVVSSSLFKMDSSGLSRTERAENRLKILLAAFSADNWRQAFDVCWDEFWDMHELFHTSNPAFTYLTDEVHQILRVMKKRWDTEGRGPLITLDAGPNIHCLFHKRDQDLVANWISQFEPKGQR